MTYEELLAKIDYTVAIYEGLSVLDTRVLTAYLKALRAVVELHKPEYWENIHDPSWNGNECSVCFTDGTLEIPSARIDYPCPTIQAIEKELG